ncbi:MAG TPA: DUF4350 domain-containing protein [Burkholderiales bacterium]|nr:DUF4350 domain-containing protein [Burkholderiales bacterium]
MSRTLRFALAALGVLLIGAFLSRFERVPVTERVGATGEARLRPFLAAERFSERMGLAAHELRALPELERLPAGSVLILPRQRRAVDAHVAATLAAWVQKGGHLVVEAEFEGTEDPVFARFGLRFEPRARAKQPLRLEVTGSERKLAVTSLRPGRVLAGRGEAVFRVGEADAARVLSVAAGKGVVTAAAELDFARNGFLGAHDNAELLWTILNLTPAWDLAVFHHPQRLSLLDFLVRHAAGALAAAALLLALWLWRIVPRYGTLLPDPLPVRRRLLDHLRASGRYLWARGLGGRLAAAAREAALRRVTRAYPDFAEAAPGERAARLAALAGLTPEEAGALLAPAGDAGRAAPGAEELIRLVHSAQRVHAALERGNR